ncbi:hypothetical protein ACSMXM_02805 [Pacificimonas sp. ICDLI1SI03]
MPDNIPGETVVSTPSAPMGATTTHPTISQHQNVAQNESSQDEQSGGRRRDEVKGQAKRLASDAGSRARGAAEEGKAKAAESVKSLAKSTRDAAKQFEGTQASMLSGYVNTAADSIDRFGDTLDQKSVDEIIGDAREIVRRSPAIAIGAAAAVGFMISRFIKASERAGDTEANNTTSTTRYDA